VPEAGAFLKRGFIPPLPKAPTVGEDKGRGGGVMIPLFTE